MGFSRQEHWSELPFPSPADHPDPGIEPGSYWSLPGGSDSKASACNVGDPGLTPGSGRSLEKEMATHSSTLAWKIPRTEEPGGLQSMGSQRVRHDWATSLSFFSSYIVGRLSSEPPGNINQIKTLLDKQGFKKCTSHPLFFKTKEGYMVLQNEKEYW